MNSSTHKKPVNSNDEAAEKADAPNSTNSNALLFLISIEE